MPLPISPAPTIPTRLNSMLSAPGMACRSRSGARTVDVATHHIKRPEAVQPPPPRFRLTDRRAEAGSLPLTRRGAEEASRGAKDDRIPRCGARLGPGTPDARHSKARRTKRRPLHAARPEFPRLPKRRPAPYGYCFMPKKGGPRSALRTRANSVAGNTAIPAASGKPSRRPSNSETMRAANTAFARFRSASRSPIPRKTLPLPASGSNSSSLATAPSASLPVPTCEDRSPPSSSESPSPPASGIRDPTGDP